MVVVLVPGVVCLLRLRLTLLLTYLLTYLLTTYYLLLTAAAHRRAGDGDVHAARRAQQRQLARAHRGARGGGQRATPLTRPLSASLVHGNTLVLP